MATTYRQHHQQNSSSSSTTSSTTTSSRRSSFRRWNHLTSSFTNRRHTTLFRYDNVGDGEGDGDGDEYYYSYRGGTGGGGTGGGDGQTSSTTIKGIVDTTKSNTSLRVAGGLGGEMKHEKAPKQRRNSFDQMQQEQQQHQQRQQVDDEREMNDDDEQQRQSSTVVEARTDVDVFQTEGGGKDKKSCRMVEGTRSNFASSTVREDHEATKGVTMEDASAEVTDLEEKIMSTPIEERETSKPTSTGRVEANIQDEHDECRVAPVITEGGEDFKPANNDFVRKEFFVSTPAPDVIKATEGVNIDSAAPQQLQLQQDNFPSTLEDEDNRTESNMSSSIVDSTDSIDCDSSVQTQLSNAELPLLQTNPKVVQCTCGSQPRRHPIHANKKIQEIFLPMSIQASEPSTRTTNRTLNIFRSMKYKRIEPSNDDTSKRRSMRSGATAVKPHRSHRGSFAEATAPSIHLRKELSASNIDRELDGLDELDLLVYGIDPTCFEKTVAQTTTKSLADAYDLPVDEELSAIVEESEDVSTRSHSKSSRPVVAPSSSQHRAGKLAQYLKRDAEASSMYIGVMHMDASATSNAEHSNVDHSAHVISLYGIEEELDFLPTSLKSRSTGKSPTCLPDIEQETIKESKVDKILEKYEFKKESQNDIEEKPCRQKSNKFMDEIWLQRSCESSIGRISDITDMDFLKIYESSYSESRNGEGVLSRNEEGNSLEDILKTPPKPILDSPLHCLLSEEDGSSKEELDHVVTMSL